jgi:hypothetical protein
METVVKTKFRKLFVDEAKLGEVKMLLTSKKVAFTEQKFQFDMATAAVLVAGIILGVGVVLGIQVL